MPEMALAAGISRRAALKAAVSSTRGVAWRGAALHVRVIDGRGGNAGRRYEVLLSSLPEAIQKTLSNTNVSLAAGVPACIDITPRPMPRASQGDRIELLLAAITPALKHPRGSAARAVAIKAAVRPGLALRTLQRFVSEYEAADYDLTRLGRKRPSDAGERRVWVSREFDRAYLDGGHDPRQLPHWGERRDQLLMGWWASAAQRAGWKRVRLEVQTALRIELADAGIQLPKSAVVLSQRAVMAVQHYREVDEYAHNRKAWDDGKTRIRRDNSQWRPMQEVVLDVKHLDVLVTRPDGSQVHPKMIAFMDSGTKRMFVYFVFPTKDERGVRQEHVIQAFIAMVADPEWGLPERIYMDNGSENFKLETVKPLLDMITSSGLKTVVKAKPYSGASKPIESRFSELDRAVFSQMLGYVGGDRMKARRPDLGKKTKPYPHGHDEFEAEVRFRIADFEDQAIASGPFAGRAPREIFAASGHRATTIDLLSLDAHFAEFMERTVDRGAISINGVRYRHPELPNGRRVSIAVSYRRDADPLVKIPGGDWAYLQAEQFYAPGMHDGAISAARSQSQDRRRVRDMRQALPAIDPARNMRARAGERVVALPTAAAPAPIMDVIASSQAEEMGTAWKAGAQAKLSGPTEVEKRVARQNALTEELESWYAPKRA
ncbi:Mu transposase C-terminal domain-containing protein [Sphingomonas sp. RP10(2022)]|uniref:Mu transposase C-terminal domain-containing protein n=2 Tax=Sphingomonas liriopis TaxID=2949094 RepID=A0A9X2HU72_9SPHN|nr:Mu transposase C-terminal domain-containing protein [Sphingomonas liriopis]